MTKDHRRPKFTGDQDFTGDQRSPVTSPVTKLCQWPKITGDHSSPVTRTSPVTKFHRWPNFTGDQSTPVTKLHRCPKLHRRQIVHRWTSLLPQHSTGVPHCLMETEPLALLWNKYYFDQGWPEAVTNFWPWTLKLSPNMDEMARGNSRKLGFHRGDFSRRNKSVIIPTEERGCFQLPPVVWHPLSEPRPSPRLRMARVTEGDGVELSSPNVSGIPFCDNIMNFNHELHYIMKDILIHYVENYSHF